MNVYIGTLYKEVEYIQSSGTQYIDTGFIPDQNTKAEISMGGFDTTKQAEIFGVRSAWSSDASVGRGFMFGANGPNRNYSGMFGKRYSAGVGDSFDVFNFLDGGNYILSLDQSGFYQNGVKKYTPSTVTFTAPGNLYIFALHDYALNSSGEPREFSGNKLYYFKIRDNGTLVRDFIPCYRVSDNVIGLFDKVGNKFYTNAGTGSFTKGSDVKVFQPELKNAYIGEYYPEWEVKTTTQCYYPFQDNNTDKTGKTSLSVSGTKDTLGYRFQNTNVTYTGDNASTCFCSYWIKVNSNIGQGGTNGINQVGTTWKGGMAYCPNHNNSAFVNTIQFSDGNSYYKNSSGIVKGQWYHVAYGFNGTEGYCYVNGVRQVIKSSTSYRNISGDYRYIILYQGGISIDIDLCDYIVDTVDRESEILPFFNNSKFRYGIN